MKIQNLKRSEIILELIYLCKLIGIKDSYFPKENEFEFMAEQCERIFPHVETDELRLAFEMAIAGYLEITFTQSFSLSIIGRVLKLFRENKVNKSTMSPVDYEEREHPDEIHRKNEIAMNKTLHELKNGIIKAEKMIPVYAGIFYDWLSQHETIDSYENHLKNAEKIMIREENEIGKPFDYFNYEATIQDYAKKGVLCGMFV